MRDVMPDKHVPVGNVFLKVRAGSYTFSSVPSPLQSYGIKVGYGAGGAAGPGTVRPGETAAPKQAGGCCS